MTESAKPPEDEELIAAIFSDTPTDKDRQIEELQEEIVREKDARNEDRFFFIAVCVLLFNIMIFNSMSNTSAPIAILILELLILVPLAQRLGMQEIATRLDRALHRMSGQGGG